MPPESVPDLNARRRPATAGFFFDAHEHLAAARMEVLALMAATELEPEHVQQVARLAVRLFDDLEARPNGSGEEDRFLLGAAALLHDIGWSAARDGKGHHKQSARLIREAVWAGFRADEVEVLAQIVRYHRKRPPSAEHEDFMALAPEERERVRRLAGLLRVADGLDRQHLQKVAGIRAERTADRVVVTIDGLDLDQELAAARKKADLAEAVFGCPWEFVPVAGSLERAGDTGDTFPTGRAIP